MSIQAQLTLRMQLDRRIKDEAKRRGLKISMRCKGLLDRLTTQAIERMRTAHILEDPVRAQMVEKDLSMFVNAMEEHSISLGTFPELGIGAFNRAKNELCPLWPLC